MLSRWVGFCMFSSSETLPQEKNLAEMQYRGRWLVVHPPGVNTGTYSWSPDLKNHIYKIKGLKNIWLQDHSIIPKMASEVHLLVMLPTAKMSPKFYKLIWGDTIIRIIQILDSWIAKAPWDFMTIEMKIHWKNKHDSWRISLPRLRQASLKKKSSWPSTLFRKKKTFHPVVDRVFFFHPNPWFTKHTGKAFNIQRQRNRAACKVALRYATTPCELTAALGQLHLVGAVVVVCPQVGGRFDGVNLGSGLLGIPPKKKTSYCWMLQKSGYVNTWHGAKKSYWKWWDFNYQFLNWFSRQISEPWVGKQRF